MHRLLIDSVNSSSKQVLFNFFWINIHFLFLFLFFVFLVFDFPIFLIFFILFIFIFSFSLESFTQILSAQGTLPI